MNKRIGIMGGAFDPIHIGHLATAQEALEQFELDEVIFMVAGTHPLKEHALSDSHHRVAMTRLATAGNEKFSVSDWEATRESVSYTVDTMRHLNETLPQTTRFFFITGADAIFDILEWKDSAELAKLTTFIGATRPGYDLVAAQRAHAAALNVFDVRYLEVPALAVSSTDIRTRVAQKRSIRYLVGDSVAYYIYENRLYESGSTDGT